MRNLIFIVLSLLPLASVFSQGFGFNDICTTENDRWFIAPSNNDDTGVGLSTPCTSKHLYRNGSLSIGNVLHVNDYFDFSDVTLNVNANENNKNIRLVDNGYFSLSDDLFGFYNLPSPYFTTNRFFDMGIDNNGRLNFHPEDGTTAMTIMQNQFVGIGVANPTARLQINNSTNNNSLQVRHANTTQFAANIISHGYGLNIVSSATNSSKLLYVTNGASKVMLCANANGNVGIGLANPTASLQINNSDNKNSLQVRHANTTQFAANIISHGYGLNIVSSATNTSNLLNITNGADHVVLRSNASGQTAIGTNTMAGKLTVDNTQKYPTIKVQHKQSKTSAVSIVTNRYGIYLQNKSSSSYSLWLRDGSKRSIFIAKNNGNVGIGRSNPGSPLHVTALSGTTNKIVSLFEVGNNRRLFFVPQTGAAGYNPISESNDAGIFWSDALVSGQQNSAAGLVIAPHQGSLAGIRFDADGTVTIGSGPLMKTSKSPNPNIDYKLIVSGGILTEMVKVAKVNSEDWKDTVFENGYNLKPIEEVEMFIAKNKHLPNVPSAKEVESNGLDLVQMDATLLQQVEEIWLHLIELKKENNTLKQKLSTLENQLKTK